MFQVLCLMEIKSFQANESEKGNIRKIVTWKGDIITLSINTSRVNQKKKNFFSRYKFTPNHFLSQMPPTPLSL